MLVLVASSICKVHAVTMMITFAITRKANPTRLTLLTVSGVVVLAALEALAAAVVLVLMGVVALALQSLSNHQRPSVHLIVQV